MALTEEQIKYVKSQLLKQIENFPEDKRKTAENYINSMTDKQVEEFLVKNQEKEDGAESGKNQDNSEKSEKSSAKKGGECVMCLIASKQIESLILYEDKDYTAVLEINPFSQGHTILIPKKHISASKNLKSKTFAIANKIGKHLIKKLNAENVQISSSDELKHAIINIIPIYKGQPLSYERKPAKKPELQALAIKIGALTKKEKKAESKKPIKTSKIEEKVNSLIIKFPRRIP